MIYVRTIIVITIKKIPYTADVFTRGSQIMTFDLRTLCLMIGVVNVLQLIVIFLQYLANRDYKGFGWFALGYGSMATGLMILSLSDVNSFGPLLISAINILIMCAFMFLCVGCMRFLEKKENLWIVSGVLVIFLMIHSYNLYVIDDVNARTACRSVVIAIFSLMTAHCLFYYKNSLISISANFTAAVFFVQGIFFSLYTVLVLTVTPVDSLASLFIPSKAQTASFLFTIVNSTLWMFGLIIMVNQRLNGELSEAKEQIELIFNTSPDAAVVTRMTDGVIIKTNSAFTSLTGFTNEETIGKSSLEINAWDNPSERQTVFDELRKKGIVDNFESVFRKKDGSHWFGMMSVKMFMFRDVPHIISVTRDITERKQTEEALRASEELFRLAVEASPDGFVITDLESRILMVSPSIIKMGAYGKEEDIVGRHGQEFYLPEEWPECQEYVDELLSGKLPGPKEFRAIRSDGTLIDIETNGMLMRDSKGQPKTLLYVMRDISERKLLETQRMELERKFLHAQKLESLAVMAGGIAHDFNNLLMGIMGNLELALDNPTLDEFTKLRLLNALTATERSAELSRKMLHYSGGVVFLAKEVSLSDLVTEKEDELRNMFSDNTAFEIHTPESLPTISGEPEQLTRLIRNLAINASESLEDAPGSVTITLGVMNCDEELLSQSQIDEKPDPGEFVFLEVRDTGSGINEDVKHKLFDPFYTTKFWGRGLGLPEVSGIVKSHGGAIIVDSAPGKGTCVMVFFPSRHVVSHAAEELAQSSQLEEPLVLAPSEGRTILVVDDEELVRTMLAQRLEVLGHNSILASGGEEAVKIYKERSGEIALVLLDFMMPDTNGVETFNELVRIDPNVRVVLNTGYSEDVIAEMFSGPSPNAILHKPYTMLDLKKALDQSLQ